jgi:hypothetical protein
MSLWGQFFDRHGAVRPAPTATLYWAQCKSNDCTTAWTTVQGLSIPADAAYDHARQVQSAVSSEVQDLQQGAYDVTLFTGQYLPGNYASSGGTR